MLAMFGNVKPTFQISISLSWSKAIFFCIASNVGTLSFFQNYHKKSWNNSFVPASIPAGIDSSQSQWVWLSWFQFGDSYRVRCKGSRSEEFLCSAFYHGNPTIRRGRILFVSEVLHVFKKESRNVAKPRNLYNLIAEYQQNWAEWIRLFFWYQ